jgi:hypothetical protein
MPCVTTLPVPYIAFEELDCDAAALAGSLEPLLPGSTAAAPLTSPAVATDADVVDETDSSTTAGLDFTAG